MKIGNWLVVDINNNFSHKNVLIKLKNVFPSTHFVYMMVVTALRCLILSYLKKCGRKTDKISITLLVNIYRYWEVPVYSTCGMSSGTLHI